jgi:hypothetical protein
VGEELQVELDREWELDTGMDAGREKSNGGRSVANGNTAEAVVRQAIGGGERFMDREEREGPIIGKAQE